MNALLECPDCVESWEVEEEEKSDDKTEAELIRDVLIEARALIEKGWCQFRSFTIDGIITSFCSSGAIRFAGERFLNSLVFERFRLANNMSSVIPDWNDHPSRTKQEVLDAFDKAIAWKGD